jgi:hypothetical protein
MATANKPARRGGDLAPVKYLPIRLTPDLLEKVDNVRPDMIPREPFVRHLIELGIQRLEEEG